MLKWPVEWSSTNLWDITDQDNRNELKEATINNYETDINILRKSKANAWLIQQPGGKYNYGEGWIFITHNSWAMPFWKSFVYAGARAIGLDEIRQISFEKSEFLYPFDYPGILKLSILKQETEAYQTDSKIQKEFLEIEYNKRPKGKRPNYEALGITSPFIIDCKCQGFDFP